MMGNMMDTGSIGVVVVVNLIIWTGLFVYLLRLDKKVRDMEKEP
jgi:CcmD family protein